MQFFLDPISESKVSGWARDPRRPRDRQVVEVLVDGDVVGTVTADLLRQALVKQGFGDGTYGFEMELPARYLSTGPHRVAARIAGIGVEARGSPRLLGSGSEASRPASQPAPAVPVPTPSGPVPGKVKVAKSPPPPSPPARSLQFFLDATDRGVVRGWIRDRADKRRLEIEIRVDGKKVATAVADQHLERLERAGIGDGRYGFEVSLPARFADGRPHSVSAVHVESGQEAKGSPRSFVVAPSRAGPAKAAASIPSARPTAPRRTGEAWKPSPRLVEAVAAHFAGKASLDATARREIAALLPFEDVVSALDAQAVPFPPGAPWEASDHHGSGLRLVIRPDPPHLASLAATIFSWSLLSGEPPVLTRAPGELDPVIGALAAKLGVKALDKAGAGTDGFTLLCRSGDVFHPRLPSALAAIPSRYQAVAWETLSVAAPPGAASPGAGPSGGSGLRFRLRPSVPAAELVSDAPPNPVAIRGGRLALPRLSERSALVLPDMFSARYLPVGDVASGFAPPDAPSLSAHARLEVVIAGGGAEAVGQTLKSLGQQSGCTFSVAVASSDAGSDVPDGVRLTPVAPELGREAGWVAGSGPADIHVLIEAGLTFADADALRRLAGWAAVDGAGVAAAPVSRARGKAGPLAHPTARNNGARADPVPVNLMQVDATPYEDLRCWAVSRDALASGGITLAALVEGSLAFCMHLHRAGHPTISTGRSVAVLGPEAAVAPAASGLSLVLYPETVGLDLMRACIKPMSPNAASVMPQRSRATVNGGGTADGRDLSSIVLPDGAVGAGRDDLIRALRAAQITIQAAETGLQDALRRAAEL